MIVMSVRIDSLFCSKYQILFLNSCRVRERKAAQEKKSVPDDIPMTHTPNSPKPVQERHRPSKKATHRKPLRIPYSKPHPTVITRS